MRAAKGLLVIAFAMSITAEASANGRFPAAQQFEVDPSDASHVFLRTSFGLLVSRDGGKTWRWLCERALGYEGIWDPPIAATRDGRLWVGLESGLVWTRDDGCTVERVPELEGETVKDLTVEPKNETVWAITGVPGKKSRVWRRLAATGKFEALAALDDVNLMSIEVAPSSSQRVYLSGQPYSTIRGQIYRSDDGGRTFRTDIGDGGAASSGLVGEGPFMIGAIDHDDPSRLLVRHLHTKGSDVLLTTDGGRTFKNVLSMKSAMYGFAKTADGSKYWAGSGLEQDGIFLSTDRGETFRNIAHHGVLCLFWTPTTMYVGENPLTVGGYNIATSNDDAVTITPVTRFSDVLGSVECKGASADAGMAMCAAAWPETLAFMLPPPDAGAPPPTEAVDGGRKKKRRRDGGTGTDPAPARSSCGCEAVGAPSRLDHAWLTVLGLVACLRFRYRRPSRMDRSPSIPA